jgi:hypothetical protein
LRISLQLLQLDDAAGAATDALLELPEERETRAVEDH